ncbi:Lipid carrier : UDP-N-acetylgalactosaminyltransferase / Alpha-1,3-N-acetylgalactosamine transferase PglA; Putative glycosyltransferase [Klebsiella pneumoniae]|nr:ABC transporter permease [Klebsiella pneumoniae]SJN02397.1 Lipid carrier : UDP-N-acetylgalactosaminyltransferase / Alpha-1,3-N-acetylgalactosamine transferase PglA; Putative glycosyltransferase [Klebsiella pneumoniae]SJN07524.1 Lipid carrier : UDP-N-acetylgalactosaminyltransferase / Alpha-1,3-N-acetylgalactosamine transferase PglA; Putative glycosyltransferase [Klebsiella pneumoniae]SKC28384.1 Lipid carrier : UDP-N-acetylgalactosaminyltransferase / Alpha-1,3-N-acetylgalactosamine transferase 
MRIVYFVNAAWYFELHWLDRSEAAISKGYEVHLVSNFADDAIKNNLEKKGIKCWDIELNRFSKNVFKNISILTAFRKICKQIKPDLIHLITIKPILFGEYNKAVKIMIGTLVNISKIIIQKRELIWQMSKRDVMGRYKGSFLGLAWSLFNPILMLTVYTFVFSVIFKSRWGSSPDTGHADFAIILFTGLIIFNLFAECINRSTSLITSNVNFVKKVVFPIEILPIVNLLAALFHASISLIVLFIAILVFKHQLHFTVLLLPVITIPLMLSILGLSWILASLGVFVRDMPQTISIIVTILMFLSPVFYPLSALPVVFQKIVMLNPLAFMIEEARKVVYWGIEPNWTMLAINMLIGLVICAAGFLFFQKTKKGFADVI